MAQGLTSAAAGGVVESDRGAAILDAAMQLFAELGFHGTTIPQVAERAGVATGTIYRYFASKEALVNAVFQREKEALGRALLDDFPFEAPIREQFHVFWTRYVAHVKRHPASFVFLEQHHHASYLDDKSREVEMRVLEVVLAFVENAQRLQAFKPLPAPVIIAMVYGSFAYMVKGSTTGYFSLDDEIVDGVENCLWQAIQR